MDNRLQKRAISRNRRKFRVRKFVKGNHERPRLTVNKSNAHLYAQLIDDQAGNTIFGIGTLSKANNDSQFNKISKESARHIGEQIAKAAKAKGIEKVVFDRGIYKYHGVIAELADAARKAGLQF